MSLNCFKFKFSSKTLQILFFLINFSNFCQSSGNGSDNGRRSELEDGEEEDNDDENKNKRKLVSFVFDAFLDFQVIRAVLIFSVPLIY